MAYLLTDHYSIANIFLLNAILGPHEVTSRWHFWFVEMLVYILVVALTALMAVPWADPWERRAPFGFALFPAAIALLSRYDLVDLAYPTSVLALLAGLGSRPRPPPPVDSLHHHFDDRPVLL